MDRVVEESAALDSTLLSQDPEQYDKLAAGLSSKLKRITLDDLSLTPDILNVGHSLQVIGSREMLCKH